ncbi:MAG TPA: hypothetical protein VKA46_11170 [Gemmataceae bacterium]|nr:hypothetical protein [Gemmataceae bacterium]
MNALANDEVGKYLNENFVSSYQKVATFKVVDGQKQGGNVASYFCAPDGRVLHVVAGPVDAATLLREAKWVVETTKLAMKEAKDDGAKFKAHFRKAHAEKLRTENGLTVEPVLFDPVIEQDPKSALTYNDPSGQPLAPKLPPPPIDGPDVTFRAKAEAANKDAAPGSAMLADRKGGRWVLNNQGRVHMIMAAHCMSKIENVYGTVFENILGEKISTKPVEIVSPFPWVKPVKGG